ncbi:HAD family phosphatase [Zeaxanthinibacter sp. PT1]|uniref:HAD family hydrolase n=1 Tax=Zeaxanthinibacter TaxID=561554 RepID=UPI00234B0BF6|nr:HAD family phosphatase [Zeaxanthinibacter sp. PT1]MDC6351758.1 HAD family phosphatase [Zeaxanthinibacter sp. PT1]
MINNIIFDFGDVFLNLDKSAPYRSLSEQELLEAGPELYAINSAYEIGSLDSSTFIKRMGHLFKGRSSHELESLWNSMLLDLPEERLKFVEELSDTSSHRLFLLSNTNELHISHVKASIGKDRYNRFKNCFEQFYLSHEIGLRKPEEAIFRFVLEENGLTAEETLFIDDTLEHVEAARRLGIQGWHLQVGKEDVTELKSRL